MYSRWNFVAIMCISRDLCNWIFNAAILDFWLPLTYEPLQLRFQRIQLESAWWAAISYASYAAAHLMTDGVNFRDLTRSVELFVVSDMGVGDEFYSGTRTERWGTLQSTPIAFSWTPSTEKHCDRFIRYDLNHSNGIPSTANGRWRTVSVKKPPSVIALWQALKQAL